MRLIDADKLKAEIMGWCVVTDDLFGMGRYHEREIVLQAIEESPTINAVPVVPVVRGEWREDYVYTSDPHDRLRYKCSVCGRIEYIKEPFCNCGAKMESEVEGG